LLSCTDDFHERRRMSEEECFVNLHEQGARTSVVLWPNLPQEHCSSSRRRYAGVVIPVVEKVLACEQPKMVIFLRAGQESTSSPRALLGMPRHHEMSNSSSFSLHVQRHLSSHIFIYCTSPSLFPGTCTFPGNRTPKRKKRTSSFAKPPDSLSLYPTPRYSQDGRMRYLPNPL
jgi:hypothetical protein